MQLREWVKAIISGYEIYPAVCDSADRKIDRLAGFNNYSCDAERSAEKICDLIEIKNNAINLKLICDMIKAAALPAEWEAVYSRYSLNQGPCVLADKYGISQKTVNNKVGRGIRSAVEALKVSGMDEAYFESAFAREKKWLKAVLSARIYR